MPPPFLSRAGAALLAVMLPSIASAASLRVDPLFVLPVTEPQRDYFGPGAGIDLTGTLAPTDWLDLGLQVGYLAVTRASTSPLTLGGSELHAGLAGVLHLPTAGRSWKPFLEVGGGWALTGTLSRVDLSVSAGALFAVLDKHLWLGPRVGYRHIFRLSDEATFATRDVGLLFFGLSFEVPFSQQTTTEVEDVPAARASDGDGDGVPDTTDACPQVFGIAALRGCPDDDPDHDGIRGSADTCPTQAEDLDGFKDDDGCPEADNDGDTILDAADECPNDAGPAATRGCPDSDSDAVPDQSDQCPKVAGPPDNGGCPRYRSVRVTESKLELAQKIYFAFGLTRILPKSYPLLSEVVQAMKDRGRLCLRIEGHTDAVGSAEKNLKLSQGRAEAVRDFLVSNGLVATNFAPKGYGSTLPLDSNANEIGREKNRRVEFVIIPCNEVASP